MTRRSSLDVLLGKVFAGRKTLDLRAYRDPTRAPGLGAMAVEGAIGWGQSDPANFAIACAACLREPAVRAATQTPPVGPNVGYGLCARCFSKDPEATARVVATHLADGSIEVEDALTHGDGA